MISIFSDLLEECMEVFMDDFRVYAKSFEACLDNLSKVLHRYIDRNLVLKFEKCHFMVTKGIILGHLVSARGIMVDKAKVDVISSLSNSASIFYKRFIKDFSKISLPLSALYERILGAEEKTHVRSHPPSTKLGASIRINMQCLQL
ncbi:Retrovirus-related Pol polyprotein from transposon opus, partial [Mucuna pruriens]